MGEDVEYRLADPVGCRPRGLLRRPVQAPALERTADDPHFRWPAAGWSEPSWSQRTRGETSSISPRSSPPSEKGPKEMRMRRLTVRPRKSQTSLISRFLPSVSAKSSHRLAPWRLLYRRMDGAVADAVDDDAFLQASESDLLGAAVRPNPIATGPAGRRQLEPSFELAVVGQEKEPLAVDVQATERRRGGEDGKAGSQRRSGAPGGRGG